MKQRFTTQRDHLTQWVRDARYESDESLAAATCVRAVADGYPESTVWAALLRTGHSLPGIARRRILWASAVNHVADSGSPAARRDQRIAITRRVVGRLLSPIDPEIVKPADTARLRRAFAMIGLDALAVVDQPERDGVIVGPANLAIQLGVTKVTAAKVIARLKQLGWIRPIKRLSGGAVIYRVCRLAGDAVAVADEHADIVDALAYDAPHPVADVVRSAPGLGWQTGQRSAWPVALADAAGWRKTGRNARTATDKTLEARAASIGARPSAQTTKTVRAWLTDTTELGDGVLATGLETRARVEGVREAVAARRDAWRADVVADRERRVVVEQRRQTTRAARRAIRDADAGWSIDPADAGAWTTRLRDGLAGDLAEDVRARLAELVAADLTAAGLSGSAATVRGLAVAYLPASAAGDDVRGYAGLAVAVEVADGDRADVGRAVADELQRAGRTKTEAVAVGLRLARLDAVAT